MRKRREKRYRYCTNLYLFVCLLQVYRWSWKKKKYKFITLGTLHAELSDQIACAFKLFIIYTMAIGSDSQIICTYRIMSYGHNFNITIHVILYYFQISAVYCDIYLFNCTNKSNFSLFYYTHIFLNYIFEFANLLFLFFWKFEYLNYSFI